MLIDFDVAEWAYRPGRRQVDLQHAAVMLLRVESGNCIHAGQRAAASPTEHFVMRSAGSSKSSIVTEQWSQCRAWLIVLRQNAAIDRNIGLRPISRQARRSDTVQI